jgi:hypothetical protein
MNREVFVPQALFRLQLPHFMWLVAAQFWFHKTSLELIELLLRRLMLFGPNSKHRRLVASIRKQGNDSTELHSGLDEWDFRKVWQEQNSLQRPQRKR